MHIKETLKKYEFIRTIYSWLVESRYRIATYISPKLNTKIRYKQFFEKKLDLNNPKTLNEKILWLKLNRYMKDPLVIQCADKYRVREYVRKCGCGEILNDLIGVYNKVEEIPWEKLPNEFVLKWNFGCGMNIICTNKSLMDKDEVFKQMREWEKDKYWLTYSEMQYKYMPKKILCERLLKDKLFE
ncbi:MAG: ATP-grasp fold amidoligase family protein [Candidatus Limivicinus sp.]|jgi:hypothetical protein